MHPLEELTARIRIQSKHLDTFDSMKQREVWSRERDRLFELRGELQRLLRNNQHWTVRTVIISRILQLIVSQDLASNEGSVVKSLVAPSNPGDFRTTVARAILPPRSLPTGKSTADQTGYPTVKLALEEYNRILLGVPAGIEINMGVCVDPLDLYQDNLPPERSRTATWVNIHEAVSAGLNTDWDGSVRTPLQERFNRVVDIEAPVNSPIWAAIKRNLGNLK